jgi:hypothetical protein
MKKIFYISILCVLLSGCAWYSAPGGPEDTLFPNHPHNSTKWLLDWEPTDDGIQE